MSIQLENLYIYFYFGILLLFLWLYWKEYGVSVVVVVAVIIPHHPATWCQCKVFFFLALFALWLIFKYCMCILCWFFFILVQYYKFSENIYNLQSLYVGSSQIMFTTILLNMKYYFLILWIFIFSFLWLFSCFSFFFLLYVCAVLYCFCF